MSVQSISFGKKQIGYCNVIKAEDKNKTNAIIWELDSKDPQDLKDVEYSKTAGKSIYPDMYNEFIKGGSIPDYKFYIVTNGTTGEVISCAQTSVHLSRENKNVFKYLLIDELEENKKYINGADVLLAYLANDTQNNNSSNSSDKIRTAFTDRLQGALTRMKFIKRKSGIWELPKKTMKNTVDSAKEKYQLEINC